MKQAIAGVAPPSETETTVMTVWPSVAAMRLGPFPLGKMLGQLYSIDAGAYVFKLGNLLCLLTIPLALVLYLKRIGPVVATRYRLTNRRVVVERGLTCREEKGVELDRFDTIEVEVRPGQAWYHAGDLVFRKGNVETFLLEGVSRPESFRRICLKSRQAYVSVKSALENEPAYAG